MKLDFSLIENNESFMVHQHFIGDEAVILIQPRFIGAEWKPENMIFRSSVWTMNSEPISFSFKKFFNWGEKPDLVSPPDSLKGAHLMEKIDGSTLIFSRYKGHTIIRTRGTVDARNQENGHEVDLLCQKYATFISFIEQWETSDFSYILEWVSPNNRIVLSYGNEPDMFLIGIVNHSDYSYWSQSRLDEFATTMELRRPRSFSYDSIDEMKAAVTAFDGVEGICVYFRDDQEILKLKSAKYLYLHRAKSDISSLEKVIDLYMVIKDEIKHFPSYIEFFEYLVKTFDYEIATMAQSHVSRICDAQKEITKIIEGMTAFVYPLIEQPRKIAAEKILQAYGTTGRSAMCFKMLDRKPMDNDMYKKLLYQVLKN